MNTRDRIIQLKRERAAELRNANYLFSRTKRDVRRTLSPDRAIRKHIGIAIGAAALAGLVLAPAPRYQGTKEEKAGRSRRRRKNPLGKLAGLAARFMPQLKQYIPGLDALARSAERAERVEPVPAVEREEESVRQDQRKPAKKRNFLAGILLDLLPILSAKIDWAKLLEGFMQQMQTRMQHHDGHAESAPTVGVADAGTTKSNNATDTFGGRLGEI